MLVEESVQVNFDETNQVMQERPKTCADDEISIIQQAGTELENKTEETSVLPEIQSTEPEDQSTEQEVVTDRISSGLPKEWRVPRNLSLDNVIGQVQQGVSTRSALNQLYEHMAFVSQIEPKIVADALEDSSWITAMREELNQFARNEVWTLVPRTSGMNVIGTKWVFKNKLDEHGVIVRNKARLVAKGYSQEEGIDYGETYTPVARLEAMRLLLAYASMNRFKLHQMDVKSAFHNGYRDEEMYVSQPQGIEDHKHPNHVFKLKEALYGLKQAPRQWYERLSSFLLSHSYERGKTDKTLFIKKACSDIILVQVYVDDINRTY